MHYVDEGTAKPIVFVHGNPSWSFEFRNVIKPLTQSFRCIAPDHIGFGLSDKPANWNYLPQDHAQNLERLLESLDLKNITLVVGDWGGPIGLSYAIHHPDRVDNLVITNTWLWSVKSDWYYQAFSGFVGGLVGRFLIQKRNFFVRNIVPATFGNPQKLTPQVQKHLAMPLDNPAERKGNWTFPKQIIGASDWLASLWDKRAVLNDKRVLIAWGMKDIAFREKELAQWSTALPHARVIRFPDAGHFVAEEKPDELATAIQDLILGQANQS